MYQFITLGKISRNNKNNKLKILAPAWNDELTFSNGYIQFQIFKVLSGSS